MPLAKKKHIRVTPAARIKPKSAIEALTDKFNAMIEEQAGKMTDEEFKAAEEGFNRIVEKARASRSVRHDKD